MQQQENYNLFVTPDYAHLIFPSRASDFKLLGGNELSLSPPDCYPCPKHLEYLNDRLYVCGGGDEFWGPLESRITDKSYFLSRLETAWNAFSVFSEIMERAVPHERYAISAAVERAFWNEYDGVLVSPWIKSLITHLAHRHQPDAVDQATQLLVELHRAKDMNQARRAHLDRRLGAVYAGRADYLDDEGVAGCELLADYFLLQRACAEDVRNASRKRARLESTAARLTRMDNAQPGLHFRRTLAYVSNPSALFDEWILLGNDPATVDDLSQYGRSRGHLNSSILRLLPP
jgi:hypothetical protein